MSQFLAFEGDPRGNLKKKIDFSGKPQGRQELLASVHRERQAREYQKKLNAAASRLQRQITTKTHYLAIKQELISEMLKRTCEISNSTHEPTKFLPIFRLIVFSGQLIPEHYLHQAMESFDGCNSSFPFLFVKYCLDHLKELENIDVISNFFLKWKHLFLNLHVSLQQILSSLNLSVDFFVKFLGENDEFTQSSYYFMLFKAILRENFQDCLSCETYDSLKQIFHIKCLIHMLEFSQIEPKILNFFPSFPPLKIASEGISFEDKIHFMNLAKDLMPSLPFKNQDFLLFLPHESNLLSLYVNALIDFVAKQILNHSPKLLFHTSIDDEFTSEERSNVILRLSLPGDYDSILWSLLVEVQKLFGSTKHIGNFLNLFIKTEAKDLFLQLEVFSLFFLSCYLWNFSASSSSGNVAIERETVEIFLKKLRRFMHFLKEGSLKVAIFSTLSFLDRENSIREFAGVSLLFPPAAITLPASRYDLKSMKESAVILPFEVKYASFSRYLEYRLYFDSSPAPKTIFVRRGHEFEDSLGSIQELGSRSFVKFEGESGFGFGVVKEYVTNALCQAFSLESGLFSQVDDDSTLYFSPISDSHSKFELAGRLTALAVIFNLTIPVKQRLNFAFFTQFIKKRKCLFVDLAFIDEELYRNLKFLSVNDSNDLCLYFSITKKEQDGSVSEIDLIPNGKSIPVTEENKHKYIRLVGERRLNQENVLAYLRGFNALLEESLIQIFNEPELSILIFGKATEIVIENWKENTVFSGQTSNELESYFWQAVEMLTPTERTELMKFTTGFSRPPVMGFQSLQPKFTVKFTLDKVDSLPTSHTCFNTIFIPCYPNAEVFFEKLKLAVLSLSGGFHLA